MLDAVVRRDRAPQRDVLRARIALAVADGRATTEIATALGVSVPTVCKWRGRLASSGIEGLVDAARSGRPRELSDAARLELVALACEPLNDVAVDRVLSQIQRVIALRHRLDPSQREMVTQGDLLSVLRIVSASVEELALDGSVPREEFRPRLVEIVMRRAGLPAPLLGVPPTPRLQEARGAGPAAGAAAVDYRPPPGLPTWVYYVTS